MSDTATMTVPHPYAQGTGSRVSSSARARWWAAPYPRACREGRLRSHVWGDGRHIDLVLMGILRSEWDGARPGVP